MISAEVIGGIASAILALIVALVQWLGKREAQQLQSESDVARQKADLELARINAQRQSEASNDAIIKRSLDMLDIVLTRVEQSFLGGIDRIVAAQKDAQGELLKAIRSQNDQALMLMSDTRKRREDWQTAAMETMVTVPELTRQKLHASFKQVPPETGELILPRLDQVQAVIVSAIDRLEQRMIERINPDADTAVTIVQRDMQLLKADCAQVFGKINSIQELLARMKQPENCAKTEPEPPPDDPARTQEIERNTESSEETTTNGT